MSMISFVFLGLVFVAFLLMILINQTVKSEYGATKISNIVLLIVSYIFLIYVDWRFAAILALVTFVSWICADSERRGKWGVIIVLLVLAIFKYTNFFVESFTKTLGMNYTRLNIFLPLGISFYTFSAISYIIDVSRGKSQKRHLIDFALYMSFFPKFISGPIQRSDDFFNQIENKRNVGWTSFVPGIQIFVFGLFKKIVFADRLSIFVDQVYATPLAFGSMTVFFAAIAYSLQIYFDFSGYSDMAIGVAKMLGINLPRNFNLPYMSHNVTELWKRWHITLSTWLQDYVYIPLGGSRKGKIKTYLNLVLTMIFGGIWHGANWTYITWGFLHGIALAIHKLWMNITRSNSRQQTLISKTFSILSTFMFTTFCWIFFRAESISQAFLIIKRIFGFKKGLEQPYMWLIIATTALIISSVSAYFKEKNINHFIKRTNISMVEGYYPILDLSTFWGLVKFFVCCGMLLCLAYTGGSPFIYGKY